MSQILPNVVTYLRWPCAWCGQTHTRVLDPDEARQVVICETISLNPYPTDTQVTFTVTMPVDLRCTVEDVEDAEVRW